MTRSALEALRAWAKALKRDATALWIAARDPRVAWRAKAVAGLTASYALSPIDLIPDFIPIFGLLDDLLLVPLGIAIAIRLIGPALMAEFRATAERRADKPVSRAAAAIIVSLWLLGVAIALWFLAGWLRPPQVTL